jgi:hypothetical protein
MKIFLSSTYEDLKEHRAKAAQAIERLGQQGIRMEVFGARSEEATGVFGNFTSNCTSINYSGRRSQRSVSENREGIAAFQSGAPQSKTGERPIASKYDYKACDFTSPL